MKMTVEFTVRINATIDVHDPNKVPKLYLKIPLETIQVSSPAKIIEVNECETVLAEVVSV